MEITPSCEVCRRQTHAKWHDVARGAINPVALIQYVEGFGASAVTSAIVGYVIAVTGLDQKAMREMLKAEEKAHD